MYLAIPRFGVEAQVDTSSPQGRICLSAPQPPSCRAARSLAAAGTILSIPRSVGGGGGRQGRVVRDNARRTHLAIEEDVVMCLKVEHGTT